MQTAAAAMAVTPPHPEDRENGVTLPQTSESSKLVFVGLVAAPVYYPDGVDWPSR